MQGTRIGLVSALESANSIYLTDFIFLICTRGCFLFLFFCILLFFFFAKRDYCDCTLPSPLYLQVSPQNICDVYIRPGGGLFPPPPPSRFFPRRKRAAVFGTAFQLSFSHLFGGFHVKLISGQVMWPHVHNFTLFVTLGNNQKGV